MKKIIIIALSVCVIAFLWWILSPLFIEKEVQDELDPAIVAALENQDREPEETPLDSIAPSPDANIATESEVLIATPEETISVPENTPAETAEEPEIQTSAPAPAATPGPVVRGPFSIDDTPGHPASGQTRIIETKDETLLRFENYDGTNGPDLRVYLATDLEATSFIDLGKAKGNKGNINYTIPDDVDVDDYAYVMTWCRAFGVLFDYAQIN